MRLEVKAGGRDAAGGGGREGRTGGVELLDAERLVLEVGAERKMPVGTDIFGRVERGFGQRHRAVEIERGAAVQLPGRAQLHGGAAGDLLAREGAEWRQSRDVERKVSARRLRDQPDRAVPLQPRRAQRGGERHCRMFARPGQREVEIQWRVELRSGDMADQSTGWLGHMQRRLHPVLVECCRQPVCAAVRRGRVQRRAAFPDRFQVEAAQLGQAGGPGDVERDLLAGDGGAERELGHRDAVQRERDCWECSARSA